MDIEFNRKTVRLGVFVFGIWFLSCIMSCQEFRYSWSGKETTATVSKIQAERGRYGNQAGYRIWYNFENENTNRRVDGYTVVGNDEADAFTVGQELQIEYYGDEIFTSRLEGRGNTFWLIVFFGSLAAVIGIGVYLTLKDGRAKKPQRRKK